MSSAEYQDPETLESYGLGDSTMPCAMVKMGHKHTPHIHNRYGNGDSCCPGYPRHPLLVIPLYTRRTT
jgi:hypothetical protein